MNKAFLPHEQSRKVAFVASIYGHFGAFHLPYMELLQQHGCEVHAYAQPGQERERLERLGVVCHDVPISRSPLQAGNWRALGLLTESFRTEKFRLVHVHTPVASFLGRIAARRAGVPCTMYTAHGFHFYAGAPLLNWLLYYPLERLLARWTDILITMNGEDWERSLKFPVRRKAVYVPGVGLDLGVYGSGSPGSPDSPGGAVPAPRTKAEAWQALGLPQLAEEPDACVVLCIAELNANKNQRQLVEALGRIRAEAGSARGLQLVLAGTGPSEPELLAHAERLGVRDRVHALGFRRDIPALLRACDAAALVSYREGLPRAVMEAMAAGKPVIGTRIRGIRDLIADAATGWLVPVGDAGATADALRRLRDDPAHARAMGEAGRERIKGFGLPAVLREMEALYIEALDAKPPAPAQAAPDSGSSVGPAGHEP